MSLGALWSSLVAFFARIFKRSTPPTLPLPATAAPKRTPKPDHNPRVKEPKPLKRASSAADSTARTTPVCRSRSITPKRPLSAPECVPHPPARPFLNISLSGIFASSPFPRLASDPELATPLPPPSPSPPRSPSLHTLHSRSPPTPSTPSSVVIVRLDRSSISPTTMSDGSLEVISLGDRCGPADIDRLPSPWSPVGKATSPDVWLSADGTLRNAAGPVDDSPVQSRDDSAATRTAVLSPWAASKVSSASFYSSSSAFDAFGISVFVDLDDVQDQLDKGNDVGDDTASTPKLNEVRDESRPTIVMTPPPRKRRETLPSVTGSNAPTRAKYHSTPLTKLDNVDISHVCSTSSISSMAYELRLGLFADGRSMTAIENIISLLDQASPELAPTHSSAMHAVVEVV